MDKVLVEVYIPVLDRSVEAFVPPELRGSEALALLKKAAADMSDGRFVPNEQTTLCRREDGMILNINLSVYELGIRNGPQLMLI